MGCDECRAHTSDKHVLSVCAHGSKGHNKTVQCGSILFLTNVQHGTQPRKTQTTPAELQATVRLSECCHVCNCALMTQLSDDAVKTAPSKH